MTGHNPGAAGAAHTTPLTAVLRRPYGTVEAAVTVVGEHLRPARRGRERAALHRQRRLNHVRLNGGLRSRSDLGARLHAVVALAVAWLIFRRRDVAGAWR